MHDCILVVKGAKCELRGQKVALDRVGSVWNATIEEMNEPK